MAATKTRDQGKTSFVKEYLIDHPQANTHLVNGAWAEAGMEGTISETLVNKTRSQMGLTGNLRGVPRRKRESVAASATTTAVKPPYTGKKRGANPSCRWLT